MNSNGSNKNGAFKTIVVGIDFSRHSQKAVKEALEVAKQWGASVILAHIAYLNPNLEYSYFAGEDRDWEATKLYKKALKYYKIKSDADVKVIIRHGDPEEELVKIAKGHEKPIIMIGHTEKSGLQRFIKGSTSKRLALRSPVPVWIQ